MTHPIFHASFFWPLLIGGLLFYYGWVGYAYFKPTFSALFFASRIRDRSPGKQVKLSLDDLTCAFALQRKLIENREMPLDPQERVLIEQAPFKDLLRMY